VSEEKNLPIGWVETTLGDVSTPIREGVQPTEYPTLPFVGMEHVEAETMRLLGTAPASELRSNALHFYPGDVLYGRLRPYLNKVLRPDFEGICSAEFVIFRQHMYLESRYLQYFLNSWAFKEFASRFYTGDRPRVDWDQLKDCLFPLPPLAEQQRIVEAIEQQFTRLESADASLKSAQARAKQYRASLLKSAVEGELTRDWRAEHPAEETGAQLLARILEERRKRWEEAELAKMRAQGITPKDNKWKQQYKEPQGPDVENLPELPEGWCWATVEQIAYVQGGIQKQPSRQPKQNAFSYLRVANVLRGRLDLSEIEKMELFGDELATLRLEPGDLLVVEGNGSRNEIGRSALWNGEIKDCVHQNHIIRVRLSQGHPHYLNYYWNSPEGTRRVTDVAASTTGLYTLSVGKISRLPVPLPPLTEQEQIVAELEQRLSVMSELEASVEASLKRAERERQSILREAFAGRLAPQNQEDEPASALLERIREERKKRAEAENQKKTQRKGERMERARKRQAEQADSDQPHKDLYETLVKAGQPTPPDVLFRAVGLKAEEQPESVEVFYEELDDAVAKGLIKDEWPSSYEVLLRAAEQDDEYVEQAEESPSGETIPEDLVQRKRKHAVTEDETPKASEEANRPSLWDE
jgi:type I restriction enzyme S subunit